MAQFRSGDLSTQDPELVAKKDDLEIPQFSAAAGEESEEGANKQIGD